MFSGRNFILIDHILVDGCLLPCCVDFEALEIVGSDHLSFLLEIRVESHREKKRL